MITLKPSDQEDDILIFGKPKEQIAQDLENGISRFGGTFRQPSYSKAYLKSARVLLNNAIDKNQLDEFGLPIFYMVRHAIELKIKDILGMAYDVLNMRYELYNTKTAFNDLPSGKQLRKLEREHDISLLYGDLIQTVKKFDLVIPSSAFETVVKLVKHYEVTPTWSRYSKSSEGLHADKEVELPIVKLVQDTEVLFEAVSYESSVFEETIVSELYSEFNFLMTRLDNRDC